MKHSNETLMLNLQLFADGSDGGNGTGVNGSAAESHGDTDLSNVKYGIDYSEEAEETPAQEAPAQESDLESEYDELVKGKYKDVHNRRMQDTVQKRVKNLQGIAEKYNLAVPVLEGLAQKYGLQNADDIAAIAAAFDDDNQMLEHEADERGITVDQLKSIKKVERENKILKAKQSAIEQEKATNAMIKQWEAQAEEAKKLYPGLDLREELQNQEFAGYLANGWTVEKAYKVVHMDDILASGMQYATQQGAQKVARSVAAGAKRPSEGGNGAGVASLHKTDVSSLTAKDLKEIQRRVQHGERISFG